MEELEIIECLYYIDLSTLYYINIYNPATPHQNRSVEKFKEAADPKTGKAHGEQVMPSYVHL